jgi:hypothetical protein
MIHKSLLVLIVTLLCAHTAFSQFGQSRRLNDEAQQLAAEATALADASYSDYTRGFRTSRVDIEAVMLAYQFSSGAQVFNRMVNDRRRNAELRDAFQVLQALSTPADRSNLQRSRWSNIQRLMSEISRELNLDSGNIPRPFPDQGFPPAGSGRMTWRGTVDDDVRIVIRGGSAEVETIGGSPYYDAVTNFTASLPLRRVNVSLVKRRGRGEIFIEQQPSRENNFAAVIRIRDPRGGASNYEFDLSW